MHGQETHYRNDPKKYDLDPTCLANKVIELKLWIHVVEMISTAQPYLPCFQFLLAQRMMEMGECGGICICLRTRSLLRTDVVTIPEKKKIRVGYSKYQTLSMVLTRTSKLHYVQILVVWSRDFEITLFIALPNTALVPNPLPLFSLTISNLFFSRKRRAVLSQINDKFKPLLS